MHTEVGHTVPHSTRLQHGNTYALPHCVAIACTALTCKGGIGDPNVNNAANAWLYACFSVASLFAPAFCNVFGPQKTLFAGTLGLVCAILLLGNKPRARMCCRHYYEPACTPCARTSCAHSSRYQLPVALLQRQMDASFGAPCFFRVLNKSSVLLAPYRYVVFVMALYFFSRGVVGGTVVIASAAVNGVSAALLWTSQGQLCMAYPTKAQKGTTDAQAYTRCTHTFAHLSGHPSISLCFVERVPNMEISKH